MQEVQTFFNSKITDLLISFSEEWRLEIEKMKVDRAKRIRSFIIGACLTGSLLFLLYANFSKTDLTNNLIISGDFSILVNLVSGYIGAWLEKITDNLPTNIRKRGQKILIKLRKEYSSITNDCMGKIESLIKFDEKVISTLWNSLL